MLRRTNFEIVDERPKQMRIGSYYPSGTRGCAPVPVPVPQSVVCYRRQPQCFRLPGSIDRCVREEVLVRGNLDFEQTMGEDDVAAEQLRVRPDPARLTSP